MLSFFWYLKAALWHMPLKSRRQSINKKKRDLFVTLKISSFHTNSIKNLSKNTEFIDYEQFFHQFNDATINTWLPTLRTEMHVEVKFLSQFKFDKIPCSFAVGEIRNNFFIWQVRKKVQNFLLKFIIDRGQMPFFYIKVIVVDYFRENFWRSIKWG